jgi:hypothetical protein
MGSIRSRSRCEGEILRGGWCAAGVLGVDYFYATSPAHQPINAKSGLRLSGSIVANGAAKLINMGQLTNPDLSDNTIDMQTFITEQSPTVNQQGFDYTKAITFKFSEVMNKILFENGISIFVGEYDPTFDKALDENLQLTSMCNGNWRVINPNAFDVSFTWDVYKSTEGSVGVVAAKSDAFFTSSIDATVRLFVGGKQQQVKTASTTACAPRDFTWAADSQEVAYKTVLSGGTFYTVAISTGVMTANNLPLVAPYYFSFDTSKGLSEILGPADGSIAENLQNIEFVPKTDYYSVNFPFSHKIIVSVFSPTTTVGQINSILTSQKLRLVGTIVDKSSTDRPMCLVFLAILSKNLDDLHSIRRVLETTPGHMVSAADAVMGPAAMNMSSDVNLNP